MQALFHPDVVELDLPMMRKALAKRGITLDFDPAWKAFRQSVETRIAERKTPEWETGPDDEERFFRLILPFSELTMNAFLQIKEGQILVWVLAVGGRMDIPYNLEKRRDVMVKGVTYSYPVGKFSLG